MRWMHSGVRLPVGRLTTWDSAARPKRVRENPRNTPGGVTCHFVLPARRLESLLDEPGYADGNLYGISIP